MAEENLSQEQIDVRTMLEKFGIWTLVVENEILELMQQAYDDGRIDGAAN